MTKSIRNILTPFLIISSVFGLRIASLSISYLKLWFSFLYLLLVWSTYYFFLTLISFSNPASIEYEFCSWLEMYTTIMSIMFGVYHNQKFLNCLKKFDIVDDTLLKLGITTDYDKLRKKTIWLVLGWFITMMLMNCTTALFIKNENDYDIVTAMFVIFVSNYPFHINAIGDLTTASILSYIGLKFDQINTHIQDLIESDRYNIKLALNPIIHSRRHRFSKALSNQCVIWIITHLHLELRKISREIDILLGTQMSFKMACYFGWLTIDLRVIFFSILINNYTKTNKYICVLLHFVWFFHNFLKFLLINYVCETTSTKANKTRDLLNRLSYSTCDEVREIISQFSLHMVYAPLRFCGVGFFQFGLKFFHRFILSVVTVSIILIQVYIN